MNQRHLIATAVGGVFTSTVSLAQNAPTEIDIAAMQPGGEPADFTFWRTGEGEAGQWTIVADPTAARGRAIAQTGKDRTDYRFPLAVYKPYTGKDLELSVRSKAVAGTVDEAAGIAYVWRHRMIITSPGPMRLKTMCAFVGWSKASANNSPAPMPK